MSSRRYSKIMASQGFCFGAVQPVRRADTYQMDVNDVMMMMTFNIKLFNISFVVILI